MPLLAATDPHPPLHYVLLHVWLALFGDGERGVRSLSVLIGVTHQEAINMARVIVLERLPEK